MLAQTKIADIYDLYAASAEADRRWTAGNNAGNGYAVGEPGTGINDLTDEIGGGLIVRADSNDAVAVYATAEGEIAVGDSGGPWAVRI